MGGFYETQINIDNIEITRITNGNPFGGMLEQLYNQIIKFDEWYILGFIFLLVFIIVQLKYLFKKQKTNQILNILIGISGLLTIIFTINFWKSPKVNVVLENWGFGDIVGVTKYDQKINKNDIIDGFKILKIEEDGVLVEYEKKTYTIKEEGIGKSIPRLSNDEIEIKKEIVTQKLLWNVNYIYEKAKDPFLEVDGGTRNYYRFEK